MRGLKPAYELYMPDRRIENFNIKKAVIDIKKLQVCQNQIRYEGTYKQRKIRQGKRYLAGPIEEAY
jgi:hypothetical protein